MALKTARLSAQEWMLQMSWSRENLVKLYRNAFDPTLLHEHGKIGSMTLYQQKHRAKRMVRAYHGDWLQERVWTKQLLNTDLRTGTVKEVVPSGEASAAGTRGRYAAYQDQAGSGGSKDNKEMPVRVPVGALMFRNLERRLDVVVFRSCFATSIHMARQMVLQGKVKLNEQMTKAPGTILHPGDLVSVEPTVIPMLKPRRPPGTSSKEDGGSTTKVGSPTHEATIPGPTSYHDPKYPLHFRLPDYASPQIFVPPYLEPSFRTCSVVYVRHPVAGPGFNEIPTPFDADGDIVRLAFERYARGRFSRSSRQLRT